MRHVFASTLASSGQVDLLTLQKLLTQASPEMVQRYSHLHDATLRRASNIMVGAVSEAVSTGQDDEARQG